MRAEMRILRQPGQRALDLNRECDPKAGNTLLQKRGCHGEIVFCFGQQSNWDQDPPSRARTRASASAAGTDCVSPAR
jgi:hypothetical protein